MTDDESHFAPADLRGEPRLIERARRVGWGLLGLSLLAMLAVRLGPGEMKTAAIVVAVTAALFGLLAIVNVALVRGLYKQLGEMAKPPPDARP